MAMSRTARKRQRARFIGLGVIVLFAVAIYIALTATNGVPGSERSNVKVAFDTVGALRVGDDVRIADIRVGSVTDIQVGKAATKTIADKAVSPSSDKAIVTMSFDGNRTVYRNATATVNQRSPLGQAYVDVDPGTTSAGKLAPHTVISTPSTSSGQDLTNVLNVLTPQTRQSLRTLVQQAGGGAAGHSQDLQDALSSLPSELPDLGNVSTALTVDNGQDLTALLQSTHEIATSFTGQQQHISALLRQLTTTFGALDDRSGESLDAVLKQAPSTLTALQRGLGAVNGPLQTTHSAVVALRPGAAALGAATPDVRGLLREAVNPLDKVPGVSRTAVNPLGRLTTLMAKASPLAPQLATTINTASQPLAVLAPYAPEASLFFTYASSALGQGDAAGHWLRFYPIIESSSLDGTLQIKDPLVSRDPYPAPGVAEHEKQTLSGTGK